MAETLAIIDYGSGNLRSVEKAVERAARETGAIMGVHVTDDARLIAEADRIILPGVGAFAACMDGLKSRPGVIEALEHAVLVRECPFLGICVGMQLLATTGHEFGEHRGLGWTNGAVRRIEEKDGRKVPHMGWNVVTASPGRNVPEILDGEAYYFLHSYHFVPENEMHGIAFTQYGEEVVAAVARDNICGVQFHPEKSQSAGIAFLSAFLQWSP